MKERLILKGKIKKGIHEPIIEKSLFEIVIIPVLTAYKITPANKNILEQTN